MTVLDELPDILIYGIRNPHFWSSYICKSILVTEIYISGRFVVRVLVDRIFTSYGCTLISFRQNMSGQILYLLDNNSGYRKKITIKKAKQRLWRLRRLSCLGASRETLLEQYISICRSVLETGCVCKKAKCKKASSKRQCGKKAKS